MWVGGFDAVSCDTDAVSRSFVSSHITADFTATAYINAKATGLAVRGRHVVGFGRDA